MELDFRSNMENQNIDYLIRLLEDKKIPVVSLKRHQYLVYQGIETEYIYILKDGVAKISNIQNDGREFNVTYISEPDYLSLLENHEKEGHSSLWNIRVESDSASFYKINREKFWQWVNSDFSLFKSVDDFYKRRLEVYLTRLQQKTINGKKGAVCACLNNLAQEFGVSKKEGILIDFLVTNEDIAGFCGISTRNSVNRIIHDLKEEHVLDVIDNKIMIYNRSYLKHYI